MGQKVAQKEDRHLLGKALSLYKLMSANKDEETAEKIRDLGRKTIGGEFTIAFCGHFSAGKSSMINRLVGENILPSSPIPTSANLVRIKSGEEYAKVFFKNGGTRLYPHPYDYETVKSYCKDGDEIEAIEISHDGTEFLKDAIIMDTPGIDSTDDAHRIATESALHLSDLIFYVMDYNHVQSELNFIFTKELTDAGKELYLVVNQIDKHQESELSFDQFKDSVETAFAGWGVKQSGIFYTSLRNGELPHNQFDELRRFMTARKEKRKELLPVSVFRSMEKLSEDHLSFLYHQVEEQVNEKEGVLGHIPLEEREQLSARLEKLMKKKEQFIEDSNPDAKFISGINEILKNAYLMPFQTRELAEAYLESIQPGFKVGMLFSKQKTEQERQARLDHFYKDLEERVQSQLDWHIKDYLRKLFSNHGISHPEILNAVQDYKIDFGKELLSQAVKSGARLSGDYVLNYTDDVVQTLKTIARKKLDPIKELFVRHARVNADEELANIAAQEVRLKELLTAWADLSSIKEGLAEQRREVSEILYGNGKNEFADEELAVFEDQSEDPEVVMSSHPDNSNHQVEEAMPAEHKEQVEEREDELEDIHDKHRKLVDKLNFASSRINGFPGLKKIARELKDKAARLNEKEFTVALFGAFSAGKSSFANALVGEKILPVSPNPTTAAINKIKPVTKDHPHGSVIVKLKNAEELMEEVDRSLRLFGKSAISFKEALEQIERLDWSDSGFNPAEKTHYSFLKAFSRGFRDLGSQLGATLATDMELFREYVAMEEKSCFVEWIEVYFDCSLTREGITLVDTPGADSINARHTGVAFDYIKNSDAILFVTYYNHAFSKADREFLIQLGRVKDTFELDKMFFIVNAVDLAGSQEEQDAVLEYVEDQLVQYGIRKPHIYPVSSLQGLQAKLKKNSDPLFSQFEQAFHSFISSGLLRMAMDAAESKWHQAVNMIEEMIHSAEEDQASRAERKRKLLSDQERMQQILKKMKGDLLLDRMASEADELTYYIRQRVFIRFGEFFRESFNPALLKDDGRNLKKALESALDELIESIGFDLAQEMRATSLRMEAFIGTILNEFQDTVMAEMSKINRTVSLAASERSELAGIDFEPAFNDLDRSDFKKALGMFRNPKAFFEKNEKKLMSDRLEQLFQEPAGDYLQRENDRLKDHYSKETETAFKLVVADYSEQVNEYFEGLTAALAGQFSIDQAREMLRELNNHESGPGMVQ
ncbi:dynamin family protein [Bacillus sp. REN3]|uniref:dynamin family protein n=1 Tax=Bacillus sp. REN3 TaxID=2802440 RepID=UPI001AEEE3D9|nr:dynamin family protein [Bacillus sp. REN3]